MTSSHSTHAAVVPPAHLALDPHREFGKPASGLRRRIYSVIFEADTLAGRLFDMVLIAAIISSVAVVILTTVASVEQRFGGWLASLEWIFTVLFTVEYLARLLCVNRPLRYATSFFGLIDLLAILPNFIAVIAPGAQVFLDIRILRLFRMFRILKLTLYVQEYAVLGDALLASRRKILIFLSVVMMIVFMLGTVMYVVEGPANGFTSILTAVYWSISTMTTVGFGDITPKTDAGRLIASLMMLLNWGILAIPTGIISSELTMQRASQMSAERRCGVCATEGHESDAAFCKDCGASLVDELAANPPPR